jgi:hypothetical protein
MLCSGLKLQSRQTPRDGRESIAASKVLSNWGAKQAKQPLAEILVESAITFVVSLCTKSGGSTPGHVVKEPHRLDVWAGLSSKDARAPTQNTLE